MPHDPPPPPDDRTRIAHILRAAQDAVRFVEAREADEVLADSMRSRALVNCFAEIGEAANHLTPAARAAIGEQPWRQMVGLRNLIVHVYWGIDARQLVKTTRTDLPGFIAALRAALDAWPADPSVPPTP